MAGAVRRRHRQDLQAGEAPPQRIVAGVLQRSLGRIDDARALAGARAAGVPVPGRRQQAQTARRKRGASRARLRSSRPRHRLCLARHILATERRPAEEGAGRSPTCRRARGRSMISSVAPVIAVLVVAVLAVFSAERRIVWLHVPSKPLTTALLFLIVGWPTTRLAWWIDAGIALSVVGDIALLSSGEGAFLVGLAAFLLAHLAYVVAFARRGGLVAARRGRGGRDGHGDGAGAARDRARDGPPARSDDRLRRRDQRDGDRGVGDARRTSRRRRRWRPAARRSSMPRTPAWRSTVSAGRSRTRPFFTLGLYWIGQIGIALAARGGH